MMKKVNYAAIDVGSNAVRLLVKCVNEENASELMSKIQLIRVPLRLGEDSFTTGFISDDKEEKLVRLMKAYKQLMKIYDVVDYRACATSAMRDAQNGKSIVQRIAKKTGIRIEIIDGQQEARIIYDNHIEQLLASEENYLYVDVGGGSTEINLINNGKLIHSHSYDIGTVRMLSGMVKETEKSAMHTYLQEIVKEYSPVHIIGSGGNINKLFRLADKKDKKNAFLPIESLRNIYVSLKALSAEQRIKQFNLKPDRADVIVPAAEIFLEIASQVQSTGITVPTIGLSDGMIDNLYIQNQNKL